MVNPSRDVYKTKADVVNLTRQAVADGANLMGVGLVKDGLICGVSPRTGHAITASHLLKVTSPAAVAGFDGWLPIIHTGSTTATAGFAVINPDTPIAFGTDWTEQSTGAVIFNINVSFSFNSSNYVALSGAGTFFYYPYYDSVNGVIGFGGRALASASDSAALKLMKDGNHSLDFNGFESYTVPSSGSGGSGSGARGGGRQLK